MTYNPRIINVDNNVVQISESLSTQLNSIQSTVLKTTTNTTLDDSHNVILVDASSGDITLALPNSSLIPGIEYVIKKLDADKAPSTYDYDPSTFRERQYLTGSFATGTSDYFGGSVALNSLGNIALIGAYQDETGSNGQPNAMGISYIFQSDLVSVDSGTGSVTISASAGNIIDNTSSINLTTQYESINIISDGTSSWFC